MEVHQFVLVDVSPLEIGITLMLPRKPGLRPGDNWRTATVAKICIIEVRTSFEPLATALDILARVEAPLVV